MSSWKDKLNGDPVPWLLENDKAQPAVRYYAMRDILGRDENDSEVKAAKAAIMTSGPVPVILAAQEREGYWVKPGSGYLKYCGTIWQIIFLSQLGANISNEKVKAGCEYVLHHNISKYGWFSVNGSPSGFIHCHAGNLEAALIDMGLLEDKRLQLALEKHARFVTGAGMASNKSVDIAERFYAYTPGPGFASGPNGGLPCGWGAVKTLRAFGKIPAQERSPLINHAVDKGVGFLLSRDPAIANYPYGSGDKPSSSWFKFGFLSGYVADVLENLEALAALGCAQDPRLANALAMVTRKQDAQGRWKLEYSYNGKMWVDIEKKGQPSKWVTLRALRVLKAAYPETG